MSANKGLTATVVKQLPFFRLAVTLTCAPGETLVLTGPSGSGKTTLLRCLAGLEPIDAGRIAFDDQLWSDPALQRHLPPQARNIGFLCQEYPLFPHMTIAENIVYAMGKREDPQPLLETFGIGRLHDKRPAAISGGERQRAALCQMLARRPQLLLLDEPYSALDRENRRIVRHTIGTIQKERSLAIIQVTHDLSEALYLPSPRILAVQEGAAASKWLRQQKECLVEEVQVLHQRHASPEANH